MRIDLVDPSSDDVADAVRKMLEGQPKSTVARDLGVSRETVYRWERGDSAPSLVHMAGLARLAGCTLNIRLNEDEHTLEDEIAELREHIRRLRERMDRWEESDEQESDFGHDTGAPSVPD